MACMLTTELQDKQIINTYKIATVACPVDVEVLDSDGNVVAATKTETFTVEDEDGTEYTYTVSVIDEEYTTIEATVIGENKMFILPDDSEYTISIVTNETYEEGDTMTYSVTTFENSTATSSITYEAVELTENASFEAAVTTSSEDIQTCTLSSGEDYLEPTEVVYHNTVSSILTGIDVAQQDNNTYLVTGEVTAVSQKIVVYCGVYQEDGKLLEVKSQSFEVSSEPQTVQIQIDFSESDGYLQIFVLDGESSAPLEEKIQWPL